MVKPTFALIAATFLSALAGAKTIVTEPLDGEHDQYCLDLLRTILNYDGGNHELEYHDFPSSQSRDVVHLEKNVLDVIWIATSKAYEQRLLPIRIPVFKGLLGHRLLVIKKDDAPRFAQLNSLDELQPFSMGQGIGWVDTDILRANGFTVQTALNHDQLYAMLDSGRFSALPRGLHEPWEELERYGDGQFMVEQTLVLSYPLPMYFFVNRDNRELARLIETNFQKMIDDGAFDAFFLNHPKIRTALESSNLSSRQVFTLENPFLPDETPLDDASYWHIPFDDYDIQ